MTMNEAAQLIGEHEYPTTNDELIAEFGEYELQYQNGSETLGEVFARLGTDTYDSVKEARTAMYCAVSNGAIGRKEYSDRGPQIRGFSDPDLVSF